MDLRMEDKDAKAREAIRTNKLTQQTNALDVDKHMFASFPAFPSIRTHDLISQYSQDGLPRREHGTSTCPKLF